MLIDVHNHLHDNRLRPYIPQIIDRLQENGIEKCVVNGTHPDDWDAVLELHQRYPDLIIPALGLHPWRVNDRPSDWFDTLSSYQKQHPYISIGECGLDRWIKHPDKQAQHECFVAQLKLATQLNLPISIHCLRAWGALIDILDSHPLPMRGIHIHGFGGSAEIARCLLKHRTYFSFCGYFLNQRKENVRNVFQFIPDNRLMVETDAPDMLPPNSYQHHVLPNQLNSPANLKVILQALAKIRSCSEGDLEKITARNSLEYFTI